MHLKPYRPFWCRKYFAPGAEVPLCYIVSISGMKHHRKMKVISTESLSRVETLSAINFCHENFCLVYTNLFSSKIRQANNYRNNYRSELGQTALERPKRDTSKKQKKIWSELKYQDMVRPKILKLSMLTFLDLRTDTLA